MLKLKYQVAESSPIPLVQQIWGQPGKAGLYGWGIDEIAIFATKITLKLVDSFTIIATMCFTYLAEHPTHVISAARRITVHIFQGPLCACV